eukprot:3996779-Prymnesium_polylepis.1
MFGTGHRPSERRAAREQRRRRLECRLGGRKVWVRSQSRAGGGNGRMAQGLGRSVPRLGRSVPRLGR